jgi:hypothetical protein
VRPEKEMPMKAWSVAVVLALVSSAPGADDGGPAWITDYDQARTVARASDKPIFLVFRCER